MYLHIMHVFIFRNANIIRQKTGFANNPGEDKNHVYQKTWGGFCCEFKAPDFLGPISNMESMQKKES